MLRTDCTIKNECTRKFNALQTVPFKFPSPSYTAYAPKPFPETKSFTFTITHKHANSKKYPKTPKPPTQVLCLLNEITIKIVAVAVGNLVVIPCGIVLARVRGSRKSVRSREVSASKNAIGPIFSQDIDVEENARSQADIVSGVESRLSGTRCSAERRIEWNILTKSLNSEIAVIDDGCRCVYGIAAKGDWAFIAREGGS